MWKLFLLSIVICTIALPARAAREKSPKKGLRKAIVYTLVFNVIYALGLLRWHG